MLPELMTTTNNNWKKDKYRIDKKTLKEEEKL